MHSDSYLTVLIQLASYTREDKANETLVNRQTPHAAILTDIYIYTYTYILYHMDLVLVTFAVLNFWRLGIFTFLFSRMCDPQYYIKCIGYISVLICALHIGHITKHVWAARRVGVAIAKQ